MITSGAGGDDIFPILRATHVLWNDMVDGQFITLLTAILASIVIAPENLLTGQMYLRARTVHHVLESDDGRFGIFTVNCTDDPTPVQHQAGFVKHDQPNGAVSAAQVDRLKISV